MSTLVHISDIARMAGVPNATVSRAINGTAKVSEERTRWVEEAIHKTGFNPNEIVCSFYRKSSRLIDYIVLSILNIFLSEVGRAIEDEVFRSGYKMALCNSNENSEREVSYIKMLMGMSADDIIITANNEHLGEEIRGCPIPTVLTDRSADASYAASAQPDNYTDVWIATERLTDCGYRKLVLIRGPIRYSSSQQRYQGYVDVCRERQIESLFVNSRHSHDEGVQSAWELFEWYPGTDGTLASTDLVTFALYKVLYEQHHKVPDNVMIVDYDDVGLSRLMILTLTMMARPIEEIGRLCVQLIVEQTEYGMIQQRENMLPVSLKTRETTGQKEGV